ncbi:MAG: adenine phosphoribosyltransferase [Candidatus Krumholzibacteriia bacterium]
MDLATIIRDIPDFPQPGILFRDITPIFEDPDAFRAALDQLRALLEDVEFDTFAAVESRGFLFAAPLAAEMRKRVVLVRKAGKLPGATHAATYQLEYGQATVELHRESCTGRRVVLLDDLLATGGTAAAAADLVRRDEGTIAAYLFLVELDFLRGREQLGDAPVLTVLRYP